MQAMDLVKTQMLLGLGTVKNPLLNLIGLNLFEIATKTFPVWSVWTKALCCPRRTPSSATQTPRASITCERGGGQQPGRPQTSTAYQTRMDAVLHTVTQLPAMKSLLSVSHHDYLPNEFESIPVDTDVFFELLDLQVLDGQPTIVKFKLVCYEHDVQHLQSFVESCTTSYERSLANKLGTHRYFFDQVIQSKIKG